MSTLNGPGVSLISIAHTGLSWCELRWRLLHSTLRCRLEVDINNINNNNINNNSKNSSSHTEIIVGICIIAVIVIKIIADGRLRVFLDPNRRAM